MKLDISLIEPNHWNPNVMKEVDFEKLRREIAFTKSNQGYPIIVRKHPSLDGMYEIVDGEHRRKAMKELGIKEVWADVQILTDKEARLKTIKSNKFRGEPDNIKLAELIMDLKDNYGVNISIFETELGYSDEEIVGFEALLKFDFEQFDEKIPEPTDDSNLNMLDEVNVMMNNRQQRLMREIMDRLGLSDNIALGVAMKHFIDSLDAEKLTEQDIVAMQMYVSEDDEPEEDLMSGPEEQILGYDELLQEIEGDI